MNTRAPEAGGSPTPDNLDNQGDPADNADAQGTETNSGDNLDQSTETNPDNSDGSNGTESNPRKRGLVGRAWDSFSKRFQGKLTEKERKQTEMDAGQLADLAARSTMGIAASIMGVKAFHDVPAYVWQKIATHVERGNILQALNEAEKKVDEGTVESQGKLLDLQYKLEAMYKKIDASERLTDEKKEALKIALREKVAKATLKTKDARLQRNKEVAAILEEAIQTRIKGRQALKEAVNTALMASGLSMMRGTAYGVFALHERHQKIQAENRSPEYKNDKSYFNRLLFDGIRQGAEKIKTGGNAESRSVRWMTRGAGLIEVLTPALRAAGFADLMVDELTDEGLSGAFTKLIEQYNDHRGDGGVWGVAKENMGEQWERRGETIKTLGEGAGIMGGSVLDAMFPAAEAAQPTEAMRAGAEALTSSSDVGELETGGTGSGMDGGNSTDVAAPPAGEAEPPAPPQEAPAATTTVEAVPGGEGVDTTVEAAEPAPESFTEFPDAQRELALTQKDDGILKLLSAQLKAEPARFGFEGDATNSSEVNTWVQKTTMEAARAQGIVRPDGDTRLTTEAIGNLSVLAKAKDGGGIEIVFFNGDQQLDTEGLQEAKLIYESGTPGLITSTGERARMNIVEGRAFFIPEDLEDSDAPNELMGGRIEFRTHNGYLDDISVEARLSDTERAQMEALVDFDAANERFGDIPPNEEIVFEKVEGLTREIIATHKLILKLEDGGFGGSPEAQILRMQLSASILELDGIDGSYKGPELLDANALLPMIQEIKEFDAEALADAEGPTDGIGRLKIRGMERVSFTYTAEGRPQIDLSEAIRDMKPTLAAQAEGLMTEGWKGTVETYSLTEGRQIGEQVGRQTLLITGAIEELNNSGHGNSPEAQYLKHHLAALLETYGNILEQDNETVQKAFEYANEVGFDADNMEPLDSDLDTSSDDASLPPVARPGEDTLPPIARPAGSGGDGGGPYTTRPTSGFIPAERSDARASLDLRGEGGPFERTVFKSDSGKMKFEYNDRGEVIDASAPARMYTLTNSEVNAALAPYGINRLELQQIDLMYDKLDFRLGTFEQALGRLEHQREMLTDMQRAGLQGEPEYTFLAERIAQAEESIESKLSSIQAYSAREWNVAANQGAQERDLALERLNQRTRLIELGAEGDFRREGIAYSSDKL